jgi:hypothetical protein
MKELKYVIKFVVPCFPPNYNIFKMYFNEYKKVMMDKIESYLLDMDQIINADPEIVLALSAFIE